jgi:hypothetical protein
VCLRLLPHFNHEAMANIFSTGAGSLKMLTVRLRKTWEDRASGALRSERKARIASIFLLAERCNDIAASFSTRPSLPNADLEAEHVVHGFPIGRWFSHGFSASYVFGPSDAFSRSISNGESWRNGQIDSPARARFPAERYAPAAV